MVRMSLRLSTSHVGCKLWKAAKTANRVPFPALVNHTFHSDIGPEDDYVCTNDQISGRQESSRPVVFDLLVQSQAHGSLTTSRIINKLISFCAKLRDISRGIQFHSPIIKRGFSLNVYICSALVDMYGKCGEISSARQVFDEMHHKSIVTWNSMISGYLHFGCPEIAINMFLEMLLVGIAPTPFNVSAVLVGCSQLEARGLGTQVHCLSVKAGFIDNVAMGTVLIDVYAKCWSMDDSREVFDKMLDKNILTWSSMVVGYARNQERDEAMMLAMMLVKQMLCLDLKLNYITYNSLLSSFSRPNYLHHCKQIYCQIIRDGLQSNAYIEVSLMVAYLECGGSLEDFQELCSSVTRWDQISWNAAIADFQEALKCFFDMWQAFIDVDFFTFTSVLKAVGVTSALEEGRQIHALILKSGHAANLYVQNGLIAMYARCGIIDDSKRVFFSGDEHDIISWNSMLSGCAYHGYGIETIQLFQQMRRTNIKPNGTTFLVLLTACSHAGLWVKGLITLI